MRRLLSAFVLTFLAAVAVAAADAPPPFNPKEALRPFNDLIGTWRGTGQPEGTRAEKQRGFWTESLSWEWEFKGPDAWLTVAFEKGKYFAKGELRALPEKDQFRLTLENTAKQTLTFTGAFKDNRLTLDRTDDQTKETQRLVITLLHNNRFLYRYDVKPAERSQFAKVYQVGATKEGVPFAEGETGPECIVSGGLGTIKVTYKDQTYYVCCSGCRRAFLDEPEKYIKGYEAKKGKPRGK
jgi:hypothetical protein